MDGGTTIIQEILIKAPPSVVFEILTNPLKIVRWMGSQTKLGPRGEGMWRINVEGRAMVRGKCLRLRRNRKLMFTWGCARTRQRIAVIDSVVVISLKPRGEGTWVRLIHHKLPRTPVQYRDGAARFQLSSRNSKTATSVKGNPCRD